MPNKPHIILCLVFMFAVFLFACDSNSVYDFGTIVAPEKTLTITPSQMSQYGHQWITIDNISIEFSAEDQPLVFINQTPCLFVNILTNNSIECFVQGSNRSGAAYLTIYNGENEENNRGALQYTPPRDQAFKTFLVLGGSMLSGEQNRSLLWSKQLESIPALLASKFGSYFPQPLVKGDGVTNYLTLTNLDPQNGTYDTEAENAETEKYYNDNDLLRSMRLDDSIFPQNISVPNIDNLDELFSSSSENKRTEIFRKLVRNKTYSNNGVAPILDVNKIAPTVILLGHEFFNNILQQTIDYPVLYKYLVTNALSKLKNSLDSLEEFPYLFIMNLPPPSIYPQETYNVFARYKSILINNAIQEFADEVNSEFSNGKKIFVVDQHSMFLDILNAENSINLFDEKILVEKGDNNETNLVFTDTETDSHILGFDFMEGLFSLDRKTFTYTGNILVANLILQTINENLEIQPLTLYSLKEAILKDPLSSSEIDSQLENMLFVPKEYLQDESGFTALSADERCAIQWESQIDSYNCPISIETTTGSSFIYGDSESVIIQVSLKNFNNDTLANTNVLAKAKYGTILQEKLDTGDVGHALFTYVPTKEYNQDKIDLISGNSSLRIYASKSDE